MSALACPPRLLRALPGDARPAYRPRHARPARTRPYVLAMWEQREPARWQPLTQSLGERVLAGLARLGEAA